jgi:hypothetical protein
VAAQQAGARVPARRGARHAAVLIALVLGTACASQPQIPPVPETFRSLEAREMGCAACHDTGRAPPLEPDARATPGGHPPLVVTREMLEDLERARRGSPSP